MSLGVTLDRGTYVRVKYPESWGWLAVTLALTTAAVTGKKETYSASAICAEFLHTKYRKVGRDYVHGSIARFRADPVEPAAGTSADNSVAAGCTGRHPEDLSSPTPTPSFSSATLPCMRGSLSPICTPCVRRNDQEMCCAATIVRVRVSRHSRWPPPPPLSLPFIRLIKEGSRGKGVVEQAAREVGWM